jgi:DNA-binding CsgD family transcriptional regulator
MVAMAQRGQAPLAHVWPLLGRDVELERLGEALDDKDCHGVGLFGAAGVGKTRLARAAGALGANRGMTAVSVRATQTASGLPFAALTPLFLELGVDPKTADWPVHAIANAIAERGEKHRMVLVIDDAPMLDSSSPAVVDQLCGGAGIFLVLTVRQGPDMPATDLELWKDERVRRMRIRPLIETDLSTLLQVVLQGPVDGLALRSLSEACEGNLLLLRELLHGSLESGVLDTRHGIWRLNGSLADSPRLLGLIDNRLQGVAASHREALELISLGEPSDFRRIGDLVPPEIVESLERSGLIESVSEEGRVEFRFVHPLYAEVLRAQLPPARRSRLYGLLADATERATPLSPEQRLRVAVWRLEAGSGDPGLTVSAGQVAFDLNDFTLAARLARVAWGMSGAIDAAILMSDALDRLGWSEEVEQVMRAASPQAVTDQEITALAVRHSSALYRWPDRAEEANGLLLSAFDRLTDESCRRTIEAQRGALFLRSGDVANALAVETPLLDHLRDEAFVLATLNLGAAYSLAGCGEQALRLIDDFSATIGALVIDLPPLWADTVPVARVHALLEVVRLTEALAVARTAYQLALERGDRDGRAWMGCMVGLALLAQGNLCAAEPVLREASAVFAEMGHPGERWGLGCLALVAGQMGRAPVASAAAMEAIAPSAWKMMDVYEYRGRAWTYVANGELTLAATTLWRLVNLATEVGQLSTVASALHDLVRIGEDRRAALELSELEARVEGALMGARAAYGRAVLAGDPLVAESAADQFESCGALLFAAEAASLERTLALGAALSRRATVAGRRASRLTGQCDGASTPPLHESGEEVQLSSREREIALMAIEGLTNQSIADKLVLSKRTVENHLQRAYTKCGVTGRAELAAAIGHQPDEALSTPTPQN